MKKYVVLYLIVSLAVSSLILVNHASASIPKPAVPEFSLKSVENPYDVPPTITIDHYTGKTIITDFGRHVENKSIEIRIKNQPFTPFSINGSDVNLYYEVQIKGYYANDSSWTPFTHTPHITPIQQGEQFFQSNSDYTVISKLHDFPIGAKIDFQIRAIIGYTIIANYAFLLSHPSEFHGEIGDWSNTQTLTIGADAASNPTTPPNISGSTTAPETSPPTLKPDQTIEPATNETAKILSLAVIGVGIAIVLVSISLLVYFKKH